MSYEIEGSVSEIFETQQISDTFKKREFVIEKKETIPNRDEPIINYVKFQMTQNRCDLIEGFSVGQEVKVSFNIRGNKWENREGGISYFTNLEAWRITDVTPQPTPPDDTSMAPPSDVNFDMPDTEDEMPF